jgi:hypothetical protein
LQCIVSSANEDVLLYGHPDFEGGRVIPACSITYGGEVKKSIRVLAGQAITTSKNGKETTYLYIYAIQVPAPSSSGSSASGLQM